MLYNFGANIGDSWVLSNDTTGGCLAVTTHVLNKGSLQINNQTRRWIEIRTNSGGKYFHRGIAIEGIGIAAINNPLQSGVGQSLFPQEVACDTNLLVEYNFYNFKCFSDSLNDFNYNPTNGDCEFLLNHVGINEDKATNMIQIFPNPSTDVLHLSNADNSVLDCMLIKLYNTQGILVKEIKIEPKQFQLIIDIQSFNTGMYFGKVISESIESRSFKFVKE